MQILMLVSQIERLYQLSAPLIEQTNNINTATDIDIPDQYVKHGQTNGYKFQKNWRGPVKKIAKTLLI